MLSMPTTIHFIETTWFTYSTFFVLGAAFGAALCRLVGYLKTRRWLSATTVAALMLLIGSAAAFICHIHSTDRPFAAALRGGTKTCEIPASCIARR